MGPNLFITHTNTQTDVGCLFVFGQFYLMAFWMGFQTVGGLQTVGSLKPTCYEAFQRDGRMSPDDGDDDRTRHLRAL